MPNHKLLALTVALALCGCANVPVLDPANIVIEADASWQVHGNVRHLYRGEVYSGAIGRLALAVEVPVSRRLDLRYGVEHRSLIETGTDRGEERAFAGATWRPFGSRP